MARTAVLGFPRIGADRELKLALEQHWSGSSSYEDLQGVARQLRAANLDRAERAGIDVVPVGDFALYDHVLDTAAMAGVVAERHAGGADRFLACRGGEGVAPLEMTKWFDTNYHYLVPELAPGQRFALDGAKWLEHLGEADGRSARPRPVILGPLSLLLLAKGAPDPLSLLPALTEVYVELLTRLHRAGATEIQLDEPCLALDRDSSELDAFAVAYGQLTEAGADICLATYFAGLDAAALERITDLPLGELHVDLARAPEQLAPVLAALPDGTRLSAGVVDGRNVWATDMDAALELLGTAAHAIGSERLTIAPSCSLLHVPYRVSREHGLDPELRRWLAFGEEKLDELVVLRRALDGDDAARDELLAPMRAAVASRGASNRTHDPAVRARMDALRLGDYSRDTPLATRLRVQAERFGLPDLPTTTIGSFPQTPEIREARKRHRDGALDSDAYESFIKRQIAMMVLEQQNLGLDVLVHGEPERNDMVEYFGEQLAGFAFSEAGWVQSYGSRCVKPPILYGDVSRPAPMTVAWWRFAQSLTRRPVKAMLTGPVTILQWSFVRNDQPRPDTCAQIALAIQDEVADLEAAGAGIIQVDEAALREGLPLRRAAQDDYVRWAVDCFRLTVARATAATQIHTHMCYSDFGEIMPHIARLDADVLSIEASRSGMELLEVFRDFEYPGQIGPGVYDIHSPRVPSVQEMEELLDLAEARIGLDRLWLNPDCGLKTRAWPETRAALRNLVEVARRRREAIAGAATAAAG